MNRILFLLVALALITAVQPTPVWSTPPRPQEYSPGDCSNSGDDDEPLKTGNGVQAPSAEASTPEGRPSESPRLGAPTQAAHEPTLDCRPWHTRLVEHLAVRLCWSTLRFVK